MFEIAFVVCWLGSAWYTFAMYARSFETQFGALWRRHDPSRRIIGLEDMFFIVAFLVTGPAGTLVTIALEVIDGRPTTPSHPIWRFWKRYKEVPNA